jgi:electron transfer flavoprotein alpha subunit
VRDNYNVWVLLEAEDKKIRSSSLALIDEGKRLSDQLGGELCGIMLSPGFDRVDEAVGIHGADKLYLFHEGTAKYHNPNKYRGLLTKVLLKHKPYLFLAAATLFGSDLMPRVAAKLKAPLITNCVEIKIKGNVEFIKPVQKKRLHATIICKTDGIQMATIDPRVLKLSEEKRRLKTAKITEIVEEISDEQSPIRMVLGQ